MKFLQENCLDETHNNYVIYCLDTNELCISRKLMKDIGSSIPVFSTSKSQLKNIYEKINSEPSPNFQKIEKKKRDKRNSRLYPNEYLPIRFSQTKKKKLVKKIILFY